MKILKYVIVLLLLTLLAGADPKKDDTKNQPRKERVEVVGLFAESRVADLRTAVEAIPTLKLVALDFKTAEATLEFVPAKGCPDSKPADYVQRLNDRIRQASNHTIGFRPVTTTPREKLQLIEVAVGGCDCKSCNLGAHEAAMRVPGVVQVTVSFRDSRLTALIDPAQVNRAKVVEALQKWGVTIKAP
jgi:copper chaperone CopZ